MKYSGGYIAPFNEKFTLSENTLSEKNLPKF